MAEKAKQELERLYTIPLRETKTSPRNHQTDRAVRAVKAYLAKHMKAEDVWIDPSVNERLWERGMYKIPSRIRVRAVKFDDGVVEVSLPEAEVTASIRGEIAERREKREAEKEEKAKKAEEKKKGETKAEKEEAAGEKPKSEEGEKKEAGEGKPAKPEAKKEAPKPSAPAAGAKKIAWSERKVIDIEGIGATYDAKLAPHGIRLMDQLLRADAAALAKKSGISEALLRTWQGMADLDRLDSVNNQYAELLVRAGIAHVEDLAKEQAEAVVRKVQGYLATVERPPTVQPVNESMATEWINEARKFTRSVGTQEKPKKGQS